MSNFSTPVKNTNLTYDKFIFSIFISVDNSPEAKPGKVKYKCTFFRRLNVCSIFQDIFLIVKENEQVYISMKI